MTVISRVLYAPVRVDLQWWSQASYTASSTFKQLVTAVSHTCYLFMSKGYVTSSEYNHNSRSVSVTLQTPSLTTDLEDLCITDTLWNTALKMKIEIISYILDESSWMFLVVIYNTSMWTVWLRAPAHWQVFFKLAVRQRCYLDRVD